MKKIFKSLVSLFCAATLALGMSAGAFAAAEPYTVSASGTQVLIYQGKVVAGSYTVKSSDLSLSTHKNGTLLLSFKESDGTKRNVSLGTQSSLTLGGDISSLTLNKSLSSSCSVSIASKAKVEALTVHSAGKVTVATDATISKLTSSNKAATVKDTAGKTLKAGTVKAPTTTTTTPAKKPATSTTKKPTASSSAATGLKLTAKPIGADRGDSLNDLIDLLNDNVTARDGANDYVLGICTWNSAGSTTISDDCTMGYTFTPDVPDYEPTKGTVKIYADGNTEEITITLRNSEPILVSDDTKLSELTSEVKDELYVENDNGDSLDYSFKWNSSGGTKITASDRVRSYTFTITPKSSRYLKQEGSIQIGGVNPS